MGAAMTPQQQQFVDEYLIDLNATQAAIRAGYSKRTARSQGQRLLTNVDIGKAIEVALAARSERTEVTQDMVVRELAKIGFGDIRKLFTPGGNLLPVSDLDDDTAACLSSIEITTRKVRGGEDDEVEEVSKVRLWDKRAALVDLGRHLGMFTDKVQHSGAIGPVAITFLRQAEASAG
jgi:phage terminase small subunit